MKLNVVVILSVIIYMTVHIIRLMRKESFKFPKGFRQVDNDWEFTDQSTFSNNITYGDGFGVTIRDRWAIVTKEGDDKLYFNFNMAKESYTLTLPNTWGVVNERLRTKTNYKNKNLKIKDWYIVVHPDNGSLLFWKSGSPICCAIEYPYKWNMYYSYRPTQFDIDPSQVDDVGFLIFRQFWLVVEDGALRIFKYGSGSSDQFGLRFNGTQYEVFNSQYNKTTIQIQKTVNGYGITENREVDSCSVGQIDGWYLHNIADSEKCKQNCRLAGMLGNATYLENYYNGCAQVGENSCKFAPFRYNINNHGRCQGIAYVDKYDGKTKTGGASHCCDSNRVSKAAEDMCQQIFLAYENSNYNASAFNCSGLGEDINTESCKNPYFFQVAESGEARYCRNAYSSPSEPCNSQTYNDNNKTECCSLGFRPRDMCQNLLNKDNDPCKQMYYIQNNIMECREQGFEVCKVDGNYVLANPDECRQKGVDPCTFYEYANKNPQECRANKIEPCTKFDQYLFQNDDECRKINPAFEACEKESFLLQNAGKCRSINPKYEACKNDGYRLDPAHSKECRNPSIVNPPLEACDNNNFMLNNSVECRNVNAKYEACRNVDWMKQSQSKSRECRSVNSDLYDACKYDDYLYRSEDTAKECQLESKLKREACQNSGWLAAHSNYCRTKDGNKYEACGLDDFIFKSEDTAQECRTLGNPKREACADISWLKAHAQSCRTKAGREYEACKHDDYLLTHTQECRTAASPPIEACARPTYSKSHFDECAPLGYADCSIDNVGSGQFKDYCVGSGKPYKIQEQGSFSLLDKSEWSRGTGYDTYKNQRIYIKFAKVYQNPPSKILLYFGGSEIAWYYGKLRSGFYMVLNNQDPNGFTIDVLNTLQNRLTENWNNGTSSLTFDRNVDWYAIDVQSAANGQVLQPENCKEGVWSNWSDCLYWKTDYTMSASTTNYARTRKRYGDVQAKYGGIECSKNVETSPNGCPSTIYFEDTDLPPTTYTNTDSNIYKTTENLPGSPPIPPPPASNCAGIQISSRCSIEGQKCLPGTEGSQGKTWYCQNGYWDIIQTEDPCASFNGNSTNISQDCYNKIWIEAGCTPPGPTLGDWAKAQTKDTMVFDSYAWSVMTDDGHRNGCYTSDRSKWPETKTLYGNWINPPIKAQASKPLLTGEKVYMAHAGNYTMMVTESGVGKYYTGDIDKFRASDWDNYSSAGDNYKIRNS